MNLYHQPPVARAAQHRVVLVVAQVVGMNQEVHCCAVKVPSRKRIARVLKLGHRA